MPNYLKNINKNVADFDVLSNNPEQTANYVIHELKQYGFTAKYVHHKSIDDLIPDHYEIKIKKETIAFIYKTNACHSFNSLSLSSNVGGKETLKIATIDTILSFYLAFIFVDKPYYDVERLLCLAQFLFVLQQKNRLKQVGLLKRFSIICYGEQETLSSIRINKTKKYNKLCKNRISKDYERWFLKYVPKTKKKK